MWLSIENMPYISLGWIGLGFVIVLIGIIMLARQQVTEDEYTKYDHENNQEIFSYFLEEEEKKNEAFRQSLKKDYAGSIKEDIGVQPQARPVQKAKVQPTEAKEDVIYNQIIQLHKTGASAESIAKKMNIGVGEVKLIISLYAMR